MLGKLFRKKRYVPGTKIEYIPALDDTFREDGSYNPTRGNCMHCGKSFNRFMNEERNGLHQLGIIDKGVECYYCKKRT